MQDLSIISIQINWVYTKSKKTPAGRFFYKTFKSKHLKFLFFPPQKHSFKISDYPHNLLLQKRGIINHKSTIKIWLLKKR